MSSPPHPSVRTPRSRARAALLAGGLAIGLCLVPATASASLIPPPGPWPTTVLGAANPLMGTPYTFNGGYATGTPSFDVWLPDGRRHRRSITRTVGERTVLRGKLRNPAAHHGISGATVTVAVQSAYGGPWVAVGNARTTSEGSFHAILAAGLHRRVGVLYFPSVSYTKPLSSRRLLVRAKTRVTLGKPYRKHRTYRFDGTVSGAPVPTSGLLIALQVRNRRGNWVTARLAHTRASGRFRIRFRFPAQARLGVRIRVPAQTGWLLYGGYSQRRSIHPR